jgi:hypothetical protein
MVFKMLILLGFFAVQGGFFIHSDIHRSVVNHADYAVDNLRLEARRFAQFSGLLCAERAEMCARNMRLWTN